MLFVYVWHGIPMQISLAAADWEKNTDSCVQEGAECLADEHYMFGW